MVTRRCAHCRADVELLDEARACCPICGLDPDLPPTLTFDDAPTLLFASDARYASAAELPA